jgi:two-component system response regulator DegU
MIRKMETGRKIRVVVIDGQEVIRIGVRAALEKGDRIDIVAEGTTEADALRLTNAHHPDVLLLGLNTLDHPGPSSRNLSVFDTIRRLVKVGRANVLVLSRMAQKGLIHSVLQAGAGGFMLKDEAMHSSEVLAQAIESLAWKRNLPLSSALQEKLFLYEPEVEEMPKLTRRRIEIMQAIADNPHLTLAQVADLLGIAESTLRNNLSAISRTLETPSVSG